MVEESLLEDGVWLVAAEEGPRENGRLVGPTVETLGTLTAQVRVY